MFCPHCGKQINNGSLYCCYCGKPVGVQSNSFNVSPQVYAPVPAPAKKSNGYSVAGFVLSLVSIFFAATAASFAPAILGLIFGIIGTNKSKQLEAGKGLGIAAIVISAIVIALWLIAIVILFCMFIMHLCGYMN